MGGQRGEGEEACRGGIRKLIFIKCHIHFALVKKGLLKHEYDIINDEIIFKLLHYKYL